MSKYFIRMLRHGIWTSTTGLLFITIETVAFIISVLSVRNSWKLIQASGRCLSADIPQSQPGQRPQFPSYDGNIFGFYSSCVCNQQAIIQGLNVPLEARLLHSVVKDIG
eukprot:Filipodium_phascolosomae@DN1678_c0_g1_i2.p1